MAPLEEYEAFAAMIAEGETVDTIAATFGTTVRAVKERLRFGLVHSDIREAVRQGTISLDVMKAYASHPCVETQKRVFDGMVEGQPYDHQAWRVRNVLADQDIRADDPLAVMVMDRYREKGGEVVEGLFEEDTVLMDRPLAERIRDTMLMEEAHALRVAGGFKWCETRARIDHAELSQYGRIYTQALELDEEGETRLGKIAERLDEIASLLDAGDEAEGNLDRGALSDEYDRLEEEAETLQNGYLPEQAAHAGLVVALSSTGGFRVEMGLVRSEDYAAWQAEIAEAVEANDVDDDAEINDDGVAITDTAPPRIAPPSGSPRTGGDASSNEVDPLSLDALSGALRSDLAIERASLIEAALMEEPDLARDVLTFRLATSTFARGAVGVLGRFGLVAEAEEQRNVKKATLAAYMETLFAQPFATLTEEQREAVESWTPPGMDSLADDREDEDNATNDEEGSDRRESDNEDANLPTYSNLEPGERVVGANADGETVIEDENGVRSVTRGGVVITEPVPVIPGAGFTAPDPAKRRTEFLTEEEAESRAAA